MQNVEFYVSGLSIVLSIFLLAVNIRAYRRSGMRMFAYLMVVFITLLFDGVAILLIGFGILSLPLSNSALLLTSNIVILILFYYGVVRGS